MPTVLVVEDEWVIAEVLAVTLADAGYQVITAANGKQALACLAETRPDVIVTDTMMPILDGPGLLAALAADPISPGFGDPHERARRGRGGEVDAGLSGLPGQAFSGPGAASGPGTVLGEAANGSS